MKESTHPNLLNLFQNDDNAVINSFHNLVIYISKGKDKKRKKDLFENLLKFLKLCQYPEENKEEIEQEIIFVKPNAISKQTKEKSQLELMEIEKQVAHNEVQEMIPEIIEISEQDCITKYESEILSTNSDDVILGSEKENQTNDTAKDSPSKEPHETFLGNDIHALENEWYIFVGDNKVSDTKAGNISNSSANDEDIENELKTFENDTRKINESDTDKTQVQCNICKKRFKKGNLKKHERIHLEERQFKCKICSKSFLRQSDFITHERIHTGEMPYECNTCKKKFRQIGHLKAHDRIHAGEVPYECKTCNKRFKRTSNLKSHEKIHKN